MSGMDRLTELLPCPFCGGEATGPIDATRVLGCWRIVHKGCDTLGVVSIERSGRADAIAAWNRRASQAAPAPSDGLREAWIAGRDAAASVVAEGWAENRYQEEIDAALIALTPPAAISASPAQEGGESHD